VADTGVGLSPELAARVFDLFVQGDRDLDRSQGGLGIGLTLVRRLAEMHGGKVSVQSAGAGQGSEFTVRLPAIEAPAEQAVAHPAAEPLPAREVLVVEDNADARETLSMLLELAGHRVHAAVDGPEGLRAALEVRPDIMLVDIGLPQMDGYEVARQLRRADGEHQPYMIAITGYGSPEDRQRALDAGFDAHLVKPVDFDALTTVLQRVTSPSGLSGGAPP
jgi:CheY-like chemotaxis protein